MIVFIRASFCLFWNVKLRHVESTSVYAFNRVKFLDFFPFCVSKIQLRQLRRIFRDGWSDIGRFSLPESPSREPDGVKPEDCLSTT